LPDYTFPPYSWNNPSFISLTIGNSPSTLSALAAGQGSYFAPFDAATYAYNPYQSPQCMYQSNHEVDAIGYATVADVVRAIPTNFVVVSESNLSNGSLFFTYAWSSTSGNQADLSACTVGETVYYPGYPTSPFIWPLPMVASPPTPNPTSLSGSGSNAGATDQNYPPDSYQQPYSSANFPATQRWWWTCPYYQNGSVQSFVPDITITRRVFQDTDGFWTYQITKSGYTNTVNLPNQ
jgi:hypothetical protein